MKFRSLILPVTLALAHTLSAAVVTVSKDVDERISDDDSLQDVFPQITGILPEGRIPPALVDGRPVPGVSVPTQGNSLVLDHRDGPVFITWDLGENAANLQLDSLNLWIVGVACSKMDHYQNHLPNFVGRVSVSNDNKVFTMVPGSHVSLIAPQSKEFNLVEWKFQPGEVKGYRYLRVESFGHEGRTLRIAEIDGAISGGKVRKSTSIRTTATAMVADQITFQPPAQSQAQSAPMIVHTVRFQNDALVLAEDGRSILDFKKIVAAPGANWKLESRTANPDQLQYVYRRADGLRRTTTWTIDANSRVNGKIDITLDPQASREADYDKTLLTFSEGAIAFDGCTFGSVPAYIERRFPTQVQIGEWTPYVILPSSRSDLEVQIYMPDWYQTMGQMRSFWRGDLLDLELFAAANNRAEQLKAPGINKERWQPAVRKMKPGDTISYALTVGVFSVTPVTLGQKDIELSHAIPLVAVDTGLPNQSAPGTPTVLQRDKMEFMGFKFRPPVTDKIGHMAVDCSGLFTQAGVVDRLKKAGVGVAVLMADEYVDVSHGMSAGGRYDQMQPFLPEVIQKLDSAGIRTTWWFSPRGFLNKSWMGRPRDPLLDEHPEWFPGDAHWGGNYQTLDTYNPAANQWVMEKFASDMRKFPSICGFAFDSFPVRNSTIGGPDNATMAWQEQYWLRRYSAAIKSQRSEALVMANAATPLYDDLLSYDYTVTEHFPLMFLNEVQGGRAFGKPFAAHIQWRQLYGWYVTLAQMYHNFCDYDQTIGWMHMTWLGWLPDEVRTAAKPVDEEVIPLWYIMGKGRRVYAAQIGENVRQIEVAMPDGSKLLVLASMNAWPQNVQVVPRTLAPQRYRADISVDTCFRHAELPAVDVDLRQSGGIQMQQVAPYSISVLRFHPVN